MMKSVIFDTTLSSFGSNTGIEIPHKVMAQLNAGKRPSLIATVNGYTYQCTPGIMNGKTMLSFNSQHRQNSGLKGGDKVHVELAVAKTPRKVIIVPEFQAALEQSHTEDFFNLLSNSLQRYHCDLINDAKSEETKFRRIQKAIDLFKSGKKR